MDPPPPSNAPTQSLSPPPKPGFRSDPFVQGDPNDPARPWYIRHRMRALLATAMIPVTVGIIGFTATWLTVQSGLKSRPAYAEALALVRASEEVRAELGDTLEPSFLTTGKTDHDAGTTEMMFSVQGDQGSAGIRLFARRQDDTQDQNAHAVWAITFLDVGVKTDAGREKIITLLDGEKPQRFADDAQDR